MKFSNWILVLLALVCLPAQASAPAEEPVTWQQGVVVPVVDVLYKHHNYKSLLENFAFRPGQKAFIGLPKRQGYFGKQWFAFAGVLTGEERYFYSSKTELVASIFPDELKLTTKPETADVLVVGVHGLAEMDGEHFKSLYGRFLKAGDGEVQDGFTLPDGTCRAVRTVKDSAVQRTLVVVSVPDTPSPSAAWQVTMVSCVNRGMFYHFGYSNAGLFGREQFGHDFRGLVIMNRNMFLPAPPLIYDGKHVGQLRAAFLHEADLLHHGTPAADGKVDYEAIEAKGRDYTGMWFADPRFSGPPAKVRQFDRWAFTKGQEKMIGPNKTYIQSYYEGTLSVDDRLVLFNQAYLKEKIWGEHLLFAGVPEVASLMVVGVADLSEARSAAFRTRYRWFLSDTLGSTPGVPWQLEEVSPRDLKDSCALFRARRGLVVQSTLVVVKAEPAGVREQLPTERLTEMVDCINRGHYFLAGFSNVGFQPLGTFAAFRDDTGLPIFDGRGYTLPAKISILPIPSMRMGTMVGTTRSRALNSYYSSLISRTGKGRAGETWKMQN